MRNGEGVKSQMDDDAPRLNLSLDMEDLARTDGRSGVAAAVARTDGCSVEAAAVRDGGKSPAPPQAPSDSDCGTAHDAEWVLYHIDDMGLGAHITLG